MTVARMAPSIVISNMMIMLGHHETIGMLPVVIGHDVSVIVVSQVAAARPANPPALAMYQIQVSLSISLNSKSSIGSPLITVIPLSAMPAARRPLTARWADSPSGYNAYTAFMGTSPRAHARAKPPGTTPAM